MISLALAGTSGKSDNIEVSQNTFGREFNEALVHQVIVAGMAANRAGTKAQKTRSEVRGGGKKPWRQKGTGNARAGTITSPIWVKGGRAFAARAGRDFSQKVNKKMYQGAMRSILSELIRQERLVAVKDLVLETHKTKDLVAKLAQFNLGKSVLIVVSGEPEGNLYLAARNLPRVTVINSQAVSPLTLMKYDNVLTTVSAIRELEEVLG